MRREFNEKRKFFGFGVTRLESLWVKKIDMCGLSETSFPKDKKPFFLDFRLIQKVWEQK